MAQLSLAKIATQLESESSRDRMEALASLRQVPAVDAVPLIKKVLNDKSLQVRSMAVFALGVKPTDECFPILVQLLETEEDHGIQADAAGALGYLQDPRAFEPLVRAFYEGTDWLVRFSAVVSLGNLKDLRAHEVMIQALDSEEIILQQAAISALGEMGDIAATGSILRFAQSEDWLIRQRLAEALGTLPGEKSFSALKFLTKDSHSQVAQAAFISLKRLTDNLENTPSD